MFERLLLCSSLANSTYPPLGSNDITGCNELFKFSSAGLRWYPSSHKNVICFSLAFGSDTITLSAES